MLKWYNRQKISIRIMLGFSSLLLALAITSVIALASFGNSILGVSKYKNISETNNALVNLDERLLFFRMLIMDYIKNPTEESRIQIETTQREVDTAYTAINRKELSNTQNKSLDQVGENIKAFKASLTQMYSNHDELQDLVENKMASLSDAFRQTTDEAEQKFTTNKNKNILILLMHIKEHFALGQLYVEKFLFSNNGQDYSISKEHFTGEMEPLLAQLAANKEPGIQTIASDLTKKTADYRSMLEAISAAMMMKDEIIENRMVPLGIQIKTTMEEIRQPELVKQTKVGSNIEMISRASFFLVLIINSSCILFGLIGSFWLVRNIIKPITRMINQLSAATNQVTAASAQISSASTELSSGATHQAASIEETSASIEEMGAQARHNAESSKSVLEAVKDIANLIEANAKKALEAAQISDQSKISAERGESSINDISSAMNEIRRGSEQITNIISTINDIAQQTKMLAVNAAIEAARAGEHGQGFAVVADQVSKLAETSKSAAKEIEMLIRESVHKAESGALVANKGTDAIREILSRIQEISNLISQITNSSQQSATFIQEVKNQTMGITEAAQQESEGISQVNNAIQQIDHVTRQNSAAAEETSAAAQELHAQASSMSEVVNELNIMITGMDLQGNRQNVHDHETERLSDTSRLVMRAAKIKGKQVVRAVRDNTPRKLPADPAYETPHPRYAAQISPEDIIPMRTDFSDFQDETEFLQHTNLKNRKDVGI